MCETAANRYDNDIKIQEMVRLYSSTLKGLHTSKNQNRKVGFLAGYGNDIQILRRAGVKDCNMHIVDYNAQALYDALDRHKVQGAHGYPISLVKAIKRMHKNNLLLDCLVLDMTGCLGKKLFSSVLPFFTRNILTSGGRFGLMYRKAQDGPILEAALTPKEYAYHKEITLAKKADKEFQKVKDSRRISYLHKTLNQFGHALDNSIHFEIISAGQYQNNHSPMQWVAFDVT